MGESGTRELRLATLNKAGTVEDMSTTLFEKEDLSRIRGIEVIALNIRTSPKVYIHTDLTD